VPAYLCSRTICCNNHVLLQIKLVFRCYGCGHRKKLISRGGGAFIDFANINETNFHFTFHGISNKYNILLKCNCFRLTCLTNDGNSWLLPLLLCDNFKNKRDHLTDSCWAALTAVELQCPKSFNLSFTLSHINVCNNDNFLLGNSVINQATMCTLSVTVFSSENFSLLYRFLQNRRSMHFLSFRNVAITVVARAAEFFFVCLFAIQFVSSLLSLRNTCSSHTSIFG